MYFLVTLVKEDIGAKSINHPNYILISTYDYNSVYQTFIYIACNDSDELYSRLG